ncbi:MAG: putative oxidoreductase, partial [Gemmatimonadetes bacterium]|nr:putative oxidoreductase [Gemmatimonadota bacterium]
ATAVAALAERVRDATAGRLHAVVHLAGGFARSGPVAESDPAVWAAQWAANATTAYLVARAFLPQLRTAKGSLVFFASEAVLPGARVASVSAYVAAKGAVVSLMQAIAQEEAAHGVRANAVAPTAIRTAANLANLASLPADTPMVTREAVADVVCWLCSDQSRAVTGQVVPVR